MLLQITSHTPLYVWAILGFLVYRGVAASRDRCVSVRQVFILPAAMLVLGLHGTISRFGLATAAGVSWLLGLGIGVAMMWKYSRHGMVLDRAAGMVQLRGSWLPMALMMTIFLGKFGVAVALASAPALPGSLAFALPVCAAFGALSGAFMARPLRVAAALRLMPTAAGVAA